MQEDLTILKKGATHLQQRKELRFQFIEAHRSEFRIEKMCQVISVSRSGFYTWHHRPQSQQKKSKSCVQTQIAYHFQDHKNRYGSPKISKLLRKEGVRISTRTVSVYMRDLGLHSCVSRTFPVQTTDCNRDLPLAPNRLKQNFKVPKPNQVWVADITYIPCREGRLYLASVMDLCTREIVGWRLERRMTQELVMGALQDAYVAKRSEKELIHHSDCGSQYASFEYRKLLKTYEMKASISRKGNCCDNATMESFHSLLKKELVYVQKFKACAQAHDEIYKHIEFFYNRKRMHGSLYDLSPVHFAARFKKKEA